MAKCTLAFMYVCMFMLLCGSSVSYAAKDTTLLRPKEDRFHWYGQHFIDAENVVLTAHRECKLLSLLPRPEGEERTKEESKQLYLSCLTAIRAGYK